MRTIALALIAVLACTGAAPAAVPDAHADALAALADIRAAVGEIVHIENSYAVGHATYLRAAHRAMNALVGRHDDGYLASAGDPGDGVGTLGHLDHMLDQTASYAWTPAVEGAKANVLAAAADIQAALGDKEMEDYETDLTRTLANLALVVGHGSDDGVLGGLRGAIANTTLGVPSGATTVSGCAVPTRTPAYGVVGQHLAYVAVPEHAASVGVPAELSIRRIVVRSGALLLYTRSADESASLCRHADAGRPAATRLQRVRDVVAIRATATATPPFTAAQAHAGAGVYRQYCIQCHGADLQGTAGPSVAGKDFLHTAQINKWSLSDVRTVVVDNMPFSNPGSLTPVQYANVLAFLMASNCYKAGATPFPTKDNPGFKAIKIGSGTSVKPTNPTLGTCAVR
ncbi:MAG TPA: c-type cytochrome [Candidatus Sulfotelmatobacter sp.]|nr:c-type cytochrome [Candidatus Sulfotelmatobacter sp.]